MNYTLTLNGKSVELTDSEMDLIYEALDEFRFSGVQEEECGEVLSKIAEVSNT
jgi:hypothetical protein